MMEKEKRDFRLRPADQSDLDDLRQWKNSNKASFFLKDDIDRSQQLTWFHAFESRSDDHMFIVEQFAQGNWQKIGCMGFRKLDDEGCIDAYNIIRAKRIEPASFSMADVFLSMLKMAHNLYPDLPIRCKVIVGNPAVAWYEKQGFTKIEAYDSYFLLEFDRSKLV